MGLDARSNLRYVYRRFGAASSPPSTFMPSDPEKKLAKLRRDFAAAKAQIRALGYVLPGTVQKRRYRCGKANCRCMTQGLLHGPYHQWTRKIAGKTVNLNLDPETARRVKAWIQNDRRLRQLCGRLENTSLAVLHTPAPTRQKKPPERAAPAARRAARAVPNEGRRA